jgi:hypothetical protein
MTMRFGCEDAGSNSVRLPCSVHFSLLVALAGAVPGGSKFKRSVGGSAVMLLPIGGRSLSTEDSIYAVRSVQ